MAGMTTRPFLLAAMLLLSGLPRPARAAEPPARPPLHELLPHDTLAFVELAPGPASAGRRAPGGGALVDMGLQGLKSLGVLPDRASLVTDILGLAGEAGGNGRRSCVACLDADLRATPAGELDCASVQLVWVLETDRPADMVERLTRLLAHLSTRTTMRQAVKAAGESKREYVEFRDARWPAWLTLAWAQEAGGREATPAGGGAAHSGPDAAGTRFIVALGAGAMEHYLADRPVGEVPWKHTLASADAAAADAGLPAAGPLLARAWLSPKSFRDRFPEAMARTALWRVFAAFELGAADDSVFAARANDRALALYSATQTAGATAVTPWTVALPPTAPLLRAVPADASAYAVLRVSWPDLYRRALAVSDALTTRPGGGDASAEQVITGVARARGVDVQKDLLGRLQPLVLVHDAPRHPLGLPLMVTVVAAAEPGAEEKVKAAAARLTAAAADALHPPEAPPSVEAVPGDAAPADPPAGGGIARPRIRTAPDGISYLQFGLVGPAWGWVQNRLVVSWSPGAVRANSPAAGRVTSSAFAPPAAPEAGRARPPAAAGR
jgi:hypothetical protein